VDKGSSNQVVSASNYSIDNFARVSGSQPISAQDLEDMLKLVASGYPVIIGMMTPVSFHGFRNRLESDVLNDDDTDTNLGGHAVVLVGYNDNLRAGLILNSWGQSWGAGGLAWVGYDYLMDVVLEAYVMLDK
jgi:C1A family cysteine protease